MLEVLPEYKHHMPHPDQRKRWQPHEGVLHLFEPERGGVRWVVTRCGRVENVTLRFQAEGDTMITEDPEHPNVCARCAHSHWKWGDEQPVSNGAKAYLEAV